MRGSDLVNRFGGLVPTGLFDNAEVERFLRDIFTRRGRSNDFRELDAKLFVVAVELDSGEPVLFGGEGWDDVPISRAVQASAALPGLYPRSEEHTSELQSLMRISYAVFCSKTKTTTHKIN